MAIIASPFDLPPGRTLALDLGQARSGVAVCDELGILAAPLVTLPRRATRQADFAAIAALVRRERAVGVLVGMPGDDGVAASGQARWTRRYAGRLAGALAVPVAFWNETLSTVRAVELAAETGSRTSTDAIAAALILQEFLEARRTRWLPMEE